MWLACHRGSTGLGKGQCSWECAYACVGSSAPASPEQLMSQTNGCGHHSAGDTVLVPHQGVSSAPALPRCRCASAIAHSSLSRQGPPLSPGTHSTWARVTSCTRAGDAAGLHSCPAAADTRCSQPSSPEPLGWGRQRTEALVMEDARQDAMEEQKGTEWSGHPVSPASSLPRPCLCLCLA